MNREESQGGHDHGIARQIIAGVAIAAIVGLLGFVFSPLSPLIEYLGGVREVKVNGRGIAERLAAMEPLQSQLFTINEDVQLSKTLDDPSQPEYQVKYDKQIDGYGLVMLYVTALAERSADSALPSASFLRILVNERPCRTDGRAFENDGSARHLWPSVSCALKIGKDDAPINLTFRGYLRNVEESKPVVLSATIVLIAPSAAIAPESSRS